MFCPVYLSTFSKNQARSNLVINAGLPQVRTTALGFLKRMYEKDQLRDYIEKFALNYMQLLVHPNPPSLLFGADKDTGKRGWFPVFFRLLPGLKTFMCSFSTYYYNRAGQESILPCIYQLRK